MPVSGVSLSPSSGHLPPRHAGENDPVFSAGSGQDISMRHFRNIIPMDNRQDMLFNKFLKIFLMCALSYMSRQKHWKLTHVILPGSCRKTRLSHRAWRSGPVAPYMKNEYSGPHTDLQRPDNRAGFKQFPVTGACYVFLPSQFSLPPEPRRR